MSIEPFIRSSDLERSIEFYTQVLDFRVLVSPDSDTTSPLSNYALIEREGERIHLSKNEGDGAFGILIYVRVEKIEELVAKFFENGLTRQGGSREEIIRIELTEQTWGMKEFGIFDPDKNKITFGESIS